MRRFVAVLWVILLAGGCLRDEVRMGDANGLSRLGPRLPKVTPDVVELHYIFIERELGNKLINESIWTDANEQVVPLDQKKHFQDNGLRVAKLGSRLSPELLKLLDHANGSGQGRRFQAHSGSLNKVQATETLPRWSLFTVLDGQPRGEDLTDGQGFLYVTPAVAGDSAVELTIVPEIEYGPRTNKRVPAPDLSGWQIRNERDARVFEDLKLQLELASGEYLLVGCWPERRGTLGNQYFTKTVNDKTMQSVLLLRVVRPSHDELLTAGYELDDFFLTPFRRLSGSRSTVRETVLASDHAASSGR